MALLNDGGWIQILLFHPSKTGENLNKNPESASIKLSTSSENSKGSFHSARESLKNHLPVIYVEMFHAFLLAYHIFIGKILWTAVGGRRIYRFC